MAQAYITRMSYKQDKTPVKHVAKARVQKMAGGKAHAIGLCAPGFYAVVESSSWDPNPEGGRKMTECSIRFSSWSQIFLWDILKKLPRSNKHAIAHEKLHAKDHFAFLQKKAVILIKRMPKRLVTHPGKSNLDAKAEKAFDNALNNGLDVLAKWADATSNKKRDTQAEYDHFMKLLVGEAKATDPKLVDTLRQKVGAKHIDKWT